MNDATYFEAHSVSEALAYARARAGTFTFCGGGTDLNVNRSQGLVTQPHAVDLSNIAALQQIALAGDELRIGSMVTLNAIVNSHDAKEFCPSIVDAARSIATPVVRMTATIGGNLLVANRCTYYNQSQFWRESFGSCLKDTGETCLVTGGRDKCFSRSVSDLAPLLIALGATVTLQNESQSETLPLEQLYTGDGVRTNVCSGSATILTSISCDARPQRTFFRKLRRRESLDFSSLTGAGSTHDGRRGRICVNGMSMAPVLIEVDLVSGDLAEVQKLARRACKTVDNDLLPREYRREMMDRYLADCYHALKGD